jgi:hypothetical protein
MKISHGKKKDLILDYIIKNKGGSSQEIQRDLFPDFSIEDINFLLKEIEIHETELIKMYFGSTTSYVTKIIFAKPFLDRGGFEKIEAKEQIQNRKDLYDFKVSKFKYYTFWPLFVIAIIGFILSLYNFTNSQENEKTTKNKDPKALQKELVPKKVQTSITNQKKRDSLSTTKVLKLKTHTE